MTMLERTIFINAPADTVDAVTNDASSWPGWYAGVQKAEADDVFPEVGGKVQVAYKAAGITFNVKFTQMEFVPGQKNVVQMDGMITGLNSTTLTPEGDGTRVTFGFDYEIPGGGIGKALDKLLVERMNAEQLETSLKNLKALIEG